MLLTLNLIFKKLIVVFFLMLFFLILVSEDKLPKKYKINKFIKKLFYL